MFSKNHFETSKKCDFFRLPFHQRMVLRRSCHVTGNSCNFQCVSPPKPFKCAVTVNDNGKSETLGEVFVQLWAEVEQSDDCKHENLQTEITLQTTSPILLHIRLAHDQKINIFSTADNIQFVSNSFFFFLIFVFPIFV